MPQKKPYIRYIHILCAALLLCLIHTPFAHANSFLLTPQKAEKQEDQKVKFHYAAKAGDTIEDTLHVKRKWIYGQEPTIEVEYHTVDAQMSQNGFISMSSELTTQEHVGAWTTLSQSSSTLAQEESIPFTIQIPENATPGQYIGGFVLVEKDNETETPENNGNFTKVRLRYATSVSIDVEGEINPEFAIENFNPHIQNKELHINFDFNNKGNVVHKFQGYIEIKGLFSEERIKITERKVLPGEQITVTHEFGNLMPFIGPFDVILHIDTGANLADKAMNETFDAAIGLHYLPKTLIISLLFIFLAIYGIIYRLLKRWNTIWVPHTVKKGEHLFSIAEASHVSWKKLAKKNGLTPPYELKPKQKILIPSHAKPSTKQKEKKKSHSKPHSGS